ncbi:Peptidase family A1 domain [Arabidopsis thaliana x Arabidopsis arenosa]|uniref:Peptidase family A1 domain n=1 Tax=Arabidopsis thaliana x Arabidopsis arenosa TaxID=1240361 RepID=A0A8T1ZKF4_9BRAS|nr:Peptidase family A1 domain [Arabidopsis thaliana x Arabidopsis arenosa]
MFPLLYLCSFLSLFLLPPANLAAVSNDKKYLKLPLLRKSPFPSPTQALALDTRRLHFLSLRRKPVPFVKSPVVSGASSGSGQYFVDLRIGQPPQSLLLIADTGSDLVWVKCSACRNCSHHSPATVFFPRHSSTFSPAHCYDPVCRLVPKPGRAPRCNHTRIHSTCHYEYGYADGSLTSGLFARETTSLKTSSGKEAKLKSVAFGCGFRISGQSVSGTSFNGANGVMGLGRGPISFASQLGRRFGNKFSYCLMDYTLSPPPTSYLIIGDGGDAVSVSKLFFTPLLTNPLSPTFYYVKLKSVFVDGAKLRIDPSIWEIDDSGNGGTVVDSGTTLAFLADPAYRLVIAAVKQRMKLPNADELTPGFDLCVNVSGITKPEKILPRLKFEFSGGAVFVPPPRNYFIETEEQIQCLAIQSVNPKVGFSVIGNLMQQGFLFEFDRDRSRLGFSRRGCALP